MDNSTLFKTILRRNPLKKIYALFIVVLLTACSTNALSLTETPILPTPTLPITPSPTLTPSPTFTPTITPITWSNYGEYVDVITAKAVADYGFGNWQKLVERLVLGDSKYNQDFQYAFTYAELPYNSAMNQGYVLYVEKIPEIRQRWIDKGVTSLYVLVVAFPSSPEAALVLCGLDQNKDYKVLCPYFEGSNIWDNGADDKPLPSSKSLESLKGKLITIRFIDYIGGSKDEYMEKKWAALANPANANNPQTAGNYQNQIERRGNDLEIFKQIIFDKEGSLWKGLMIRLEEWDNKPLEFNTPEFMAAYQVWNFNHGIESPFIIPEVIGDAEAKLSAR